MTLNRELILSREFKRKQRGDTSPQDLADQEIERWVKEFRAMVSIRHSDMQDAVFVTEHLRRRRDAHVRALELAGVMLGVIVALLAVSIAGQNWVGMWLSVIAAVAMIFTTRRADRNVRRVDQQLDKLLDVTTKLPETPNPPAQMRVPVQHVRLGSWSLIRFRETE